MHIYYLLDQLPERMGKSVMLLGPSSADSEVTPWRQQVIQLFQDRGYTGDVLVPELRHRIDPAEDQSTFKWVMEACSKVDILLYWMPSKQETEPRVEINLDAGLFLSSPKLFFGVDPDAHNIQQLKVVLHYYDQPYHAELSVMVDTVLQQLDYKYSYRAVRPLRYGDMPDVADFFERQNVFIPNVYTRLQHLFITCQRVGAMMIGYFEQREHENLVGISILHYIHDVPTVPITPAVQLYIDCGCPDPERVEKALKSCAAQLVERKNQQSQYQYERRNHRFCSTAKPLDDFVWEM